MERTSSEKSDVPRLLVFSDDWGRHPSSCQHIMNQVLGQYDVTWVNTIGMRSPALDSATIRRVAGKIKSWIWQNKDRASECRTVGNEQPKVVSPVMWPWFRRETDRRINRFLLKRHLQRFCDENTIAITTIPITSDLMGVLPVKKWIYYCVDDFSEWPGLDQISMKFMEEKVIQEADLIIAASQNLKEKIEASGRDAALMTHGVNLSHWKINQMETSSPFPESFDKPFYVFWGVIDPRIDYEFVRNLNQNLESGTIVLIGPQQNPDPRLLQLAKVKTLPPVAFEELPNYGCHADVLIMPYVDAPVTQAMQPLKLLEYLATGKPVVVRDLPATDQLNEMMYLARSPEEFSTEVKFAMNEGVTETQQIARNRLVHESWSAKAEYFMSHVLKIFQA